MPRVRQNVVQNNENVIKSCVKRLKQVCRAHQKYDKHMKALLKSAIPEEANYIFPR